MKIADFFDDKLPVFVIAEIGINHNGDVETAKKLIDGAIWAGCDAVKFQKRTPEICVPETQKGTMRDTPWGRMTYIEYKRRIEFGQDEYEQINLYCAGRGILWFASCWDYPSVKFIEQFDPPLYKGASASLTDHGLLLAMQGTGKPLIQSTGMSTEREIMQAVRMLDRDNLALAHCHSAYPAPNNELNLNAIRYLREYYRLPVGYSGHETGLQTTLAAVALGASFVERHITLDRAMWGTDHAASVEVMGMYRLVRDIHEVKKALGDGIIRVYESEMGARKKLRGY